MRLDPNWENIGCQLGKQHKWEMDYGEYWKEMEDDENKTFGVIFHYKCKYCRDKTTRYGAKVPQTHLLYKLLKK